MADIYEEECLRPGDRVIAVGCGDREPAESVAKNYRDVPSSALIMHAPPGHPVIVGTLANLSRERGGVYLAGRLAMMAGVIAAIVGLFIQWLLPS